MARTRANARRWRDPSSGRLYTPFEPWLWGSVVRPIEDVLDAGADVGVHWSPTCGQIRVRDVYGIDEYDDPLPR